MILNFTLKYLKFLINFFNFILCYQVHPHTSNNDIIKIYSFLMKVNPSIMNIQKSIKININVEKHFRKIEESVIEQKWHVISTNFMKLLENGTADISFQELYETINDLLISGISLKYKDSLENILKSFAKRSYEKLLNISIQYENDIGSFLNNFNQYFLQIKKNFNIIRKIFVKYERAFYSNQTTLWTICNLMYKF